MNEFCKMIAHHGWTTSLGEGKLNSNSLATYYRPMRYVCICSTPFALEACDTRIIFKQRTASLNLEFSFF